MHPRTRELLDYLDEQRAVLRAAVDAMPSALRERTPATGQWSAAQCVEHLAIVNELVATRLTKNVAEARAKGLGPGPATDPILPHSNVEMVLDRNTKLSAPDFVRPTGVDAVAAWAALERSTVTLHDAIKAVDGLALGEVSWPHPRFGPLTAYQWIALSGAHEARHAAQIREIAAAVAG